MRFKSLRLPKLLEVVLYSPIEMVLGPYIEKAPSPETQKWLTTNFRNWLLKQTENLHQLPYLPRNATEPQKKAFSFNDLYDVRLTPATQTMIAHILDYLIAHPNLPRLERMSVPEVVKAADDEVARYNAKVAKQGTADDPKGVKTIMEFPGGYRMVEMTSKRAVDREGNLMGHCIGSHHCDAIVVNKTHRAFSLRDASNNPHATIEVIKDGNRTTEIKGAGNAAPVRRYWPMLLQFIQQYGVSVDGDHRNVGLLQIQNENGEFDTMSQDQFRDMVLDPGNVRGQQMMQRYADNPREYEHDADTSIGMFTALYGTEQLRDSTIKTVFSRDASHAVQVVQYYGNRLTPHQVETAFVALRPSYGDDVRGMYKTLLIATKPDAATCDVIIQSLNRDGGFTIALAQVMPEVYAEMLSKPGAVERELDNYDERAAGPFYVFAGTDKLIPAMVEKAIAYTSEDALKRIIKTKMPVDQEMFIAMISGVQQLRYRGDRRNEEGNVLDQVVEYAQPSAEILNAAFEAEEDRDFSAKLLLSAKRLVPNSVNKEVVERAVLAIDRDDMYRSYLHDEPDPPLIIQQRLLDKEIQYTKGLMQYLRKIDPSIYQQIRDTLKPKPIATTKTDHKQVPDKAAGPNKYKNIQVKRPLTDEEKAKERASARREGRDWFLKLLEPAIREPDSTANQLLDPKGVKFQTARAAFEAMGKAPLFDTAVRHIDRRIIVRNATPNGYGTTGDKSTFIEHIDDLTDADLVYIIQNGAYDRSWFGIVVDHAPYRVPGVIAYQRGHNNDGNYGKFNYKMNKDKAFEALEAVWASTKVPEGLKDDFTLKVFKRFKPTPDKLISMLDKADSQDATEYVLKKTKKPSRELLNFVVEGFPQLLGLVTIEAIPDDLLANLFKDDQRYAIGLMNRDLRGYGTDSRRTWATSTFRSTIDQSSETFQKYARAAQAAGKQKQFERFVKQADLEELHPQLAPEVGYNEKRKPANMELLQQHLNDYSDRTLVHVARHDRKAVTLYFNRFTPKKLLRLIGNGLLTAGHYGYNGQPDKELSVANLDQQKLYDTVMLGLPSKVDMNPLLEAMIAQNYQFDDAMIIALLQGDAGYKVKNHVLHSKLSPAIKHWVADNIPREIEDIAEPDAYVISKLFDHYGKLEKDNKGNTTVSQSFTHAVNKWFREPDYWFHYRPNPTVAKLLQAEALRRRGIAVTIIRAVFKNLDTMRQKSQEEKHFSGIDHAPVEIVPRGALAK